MDINEYIIENLREIKSEIKELRNTINKFEAFLNFFKFIFKYWQLWLVIFIFIAYLDPNKIFDFIKSFTGVF